MENYNKENNQIRRRYLSFHLDVLKEYFLLFIKTFRLSFIVNSDTYDEKKDLLSYETKIEGNNPSTQFNKVRFENGIIYFYLRISKLTYYCVEIHKVTALSQNISLLRDMITIFESNQLRLCEASHKDDIYDAFNDIFELALLKNVDFKNFRLIKQIITQFKNWSLSTYEGSKVEFCLGLSSADACNNGTSIIDFLKSKYSATISSSSNSMIVVNGYGNIVDYLSVNDNTKNLNIDCPSFCKKLLSKAIDDKQHKFSCFIVLTENNDICLMSADGTLKGLFRCNRWQLISPDTFIYHLYTSLYGVGYKGTFLKEYHNNLTLKKIFTLVVDLSLLYCGGIIAFVADKEKFLQCESISRTDNLLIKTKEDKKVITLRMLLNNKTNSFVDIDNSVLLELLEMDGATCIDFHTKQFLVAGYILKNITPIEGHGGRGAAAYHLSEYGLAIKVSEDGGITLYHNKTKIYEIK